MADVSPKGRVNAHARFSYGRAFWIVASLALLIRLTLIIVSHVVDHGDIVHPADFSDSALYVDFGALFANGLEPREQIPPDRDRLLPFVLGLVFRVTGRSVGAAQVTAAISAVLGLLWLYPLARQCLGPRTSLLACCLWTFDPSFLGQSCLPLTANLATPLVIGLLWLLVRARKRDSTALVFAAGGLLVLAIHARAGTIVLAGPVALWLLGWSGRYRRRLLLASLFSATAIAGWLSSCYVSYQLFGIFTPNTHSYQLWGHAAAKLMVQTGQAETMDEAKERRERDARSRLPADATHAEYLNGKRASDIAYIKQHPMQQLRNHLLALVATTVMPDRWSLPSLVGVYRVGGIWHKPVGLLDKARLAFQQWGPAVAAFAIAHFVFTAVLWLGVFLSIPALITGQHRAIAWLLALTLVGVIAAGAINVEATPRYRLPAVPMMALLTAMAIEHRVTRRSQPGHV